MMPQASFFVSFSIPYDKIVMMKCKNCGGVFSDELTKCPYCGTMNRKGAYKDFRKKFAAVIDSLLGLKAEAYHSISRMIFVSLLRSFLMIAICILLAFFVSRFINTNHYSDPKYDREAYEQIVWMEENIDKLNAAYETEDFTTIGALEKDNYRCVSSWEHYPSYMLKKEYYRIMDNMEKYSFNDYTFKEVLYFLFYPDYYAYVRLMPEEDKQKYEEDRRALLSEMEKYSYQEEELQQAYDASKDSYGYIDSDKVKEYMKEAQ